MIRKTILVYLNKVGRYMYVYSNFKPNKVIIKNDFKTTEILMAQDVLLKEKEKICKLMRFFCELFLEQ